MNVTPIRMAKVANARRAVAELLTGRNCPFPDEVSREVVDALRTLGWAPPGWADAEPLPQPATSTPAARAEAIAATRAAVDHARRRHTANEENRDA